MASKGNELECGKALYTLERLIRSQEHVIELDRGCYVIPVHPRPSDTFVMKYSACTGRTETCFDTLKSIPPYGLV